ncbi:hypothetical protein CR513_00739, partial [Mucuna pruriens]
MSGTAGSSTSSSSFTSTSSLEAIAAVPVAMADKVESSPRAPTLLGVEPFEWVHQDVLSYGSKMAPEEVESLAARGDWVCGPHAPQLEMTHCSPSERVCHVCKEGEGDFVYMYETVLQDLGVTFPLDHFTADVLRLVGVAPSQLHSNGWAALQALKVVCAVLTMTPSAPVFLSHYNIRVGKKVGWVSLAPLPNTSLFSAYTVSYKGFKGRFLKIRALTEGSLCTDGQPMPLYWRLPLKASGTHKSRLSPEEKVTLQLLDELPRGMNCKEIVALALGRKPASHLRSESYFSLLRRGVEMIEDEGIDMAALIRKVKLARGAGAVSAKPRAVETSTPRAE